MARQVCIKEKLLAALLTSNTRKEAAEKANVSERTIYTYLQDAAFAQQYQDGRNALIKEAAEQIQRSLSPAITALRHIAEDEASSKNARVQAARALLEYGIRLSEISDIYKRLDQLEAKDNNES